MPKRDATPRAEELPRFERKTLGEGPAISAASEGEVGGKAAGLIRAQEVLAEIFPDGAWKNLQVAVPTLVILGTDSFQAFMDRNDLWETALSELPDDRLANAFQRADLPVELTGDLRGIVTALDTPLAIRSSSLLEDATGEPFAGVYATKMIPNGQPSPDERFRRLVEAVKFVYSSTFFREARGYRVMTGRTVDEERMALVIQQVVGLPHQNRFYPTISGVARSFNFYPWGPARPEEGVIDLALGLGKTIVDGGRCWSYSPAHPQAPPPFTIADLLKQTQTEFWAVNLGKLPVFDPLTETEYLVRAGLKEAEFDGSLAYVGSTYDPGSDRVVMGTGRPGPRILDFAPTLHMNDFPLNGLVRELLRVFEDRLGSEVEIEFALDLDPLRRLPPRFGFLQVRGTTSAQEGEAVSEGDLAAADNLLASDRALGHGRRDDLSHVVYVRPEAFDKSRTPQIAREIALLNRKLQDRSVEYILIAFGRIGTTDPWLGIPVDWGQISAARVLVEATLPDMDVDLSQGSHFFHNITSLGLFLLNVHHAGPHRIDWEWLDAQPAESESEFVRHVVLEHPLAVRIDGRHRRGVVSR